MVRVQENINNQEQNRLQAEPRKILEEIKEKLKVSPCRRIGNKIAKVGLGELKEQMPQCLELYQGLISCYPNPNKGEKIALWDLKGELEKIKNEEGTSALISHRNKALAVCHYLLETT